MIEVYYVEDDEIIGKSVKEYLEQQNCKVTVFGSIADIRKAETKKEVSGFQASSRG